MVYLAIDKIEPTATAALPDLEKPADLGRRPWLYRGRGWRKDMTFESWAAFTAASTVLLIIPGPTVLLVVVSVRVLPAS